MAKNSTRVYKLCTSNAATGNNLASLRVVGSGRVTSVTYVLQGTSGAAVDGRIECELSVSNVSNITTNDTPNNVIGSHGLAWPVASSAGASSLIQDGLAFPVDTSQTLSLNQVATGTALGSFRGCIYIAVLEN